MQNYVQNPSKSPIFLTNTTSLNAKENKTEFKIESSSSVGFSLKSLQWLLPSHTYAEFVEQRKYKRQYRIY